MGWKLAFNLWVGVPDSYGVRLSLIFKSLNFLAHPTLGCQINEYLKLLTFDEHRVSIIIMEWARSANQTTYRCDVCTQDCRSSHQIIQSSFDLREIWVSNILYRKSEHRYQSNRYGINNNHLPRQCSWPFTSVVYTIAVTLESVLSRKSSLFSKFESLF